MSLLEVRTTTALLGSSSSALCRNWRVPVFEKIVGNAFHFPTRKSSRLHLPAPIPGRHGFQRRQDGCITEKNSMPGRTWWARYWRSPGRSCCCGRRFPAATAGRFLPSRSMARRWSCSTAFRPSTTAFAGGPSASCASSTTCRSTC